LGVTRCSFTSVDFDHCLDILKNTPHLTHCSLDPPSPLGAASSGVLALLNLQSLSTSQVAVLVFLDCPAIQELQLYLYSHEITSPLVMSIIKLSSQTLTHLSLIKLKLQSGDLTDELIQLLDPHPGHLALNCLLPNLRVLEHFGCFDPNHVKITSILSAQW
jgi:hypothetical protein